MNPVVLPLLEIGGRLIDKLFPDPAQREAAKLELLKQQQAGELQEVQTRLSAILAEAQSADPWTSRARPSFMYVMYAFILAHGLFFPFAAAVFGLPLDPIYASMKAGLEAVPDGMWFLFTSGYLGYTAARQYGKAQGSDK